MTPASDRAGEKIRRFVEEGGYVVTAGQQAGLFTGPLYTIHKALSAVRLAGALESLLDAPVLPLFWVASEDHDWEEADHAVVVDVDNDLRRVAVPSPTEEALPVGERKLDDGIEAAVEEFLGLLPETDFSPGYARVIRQAYRPGETLAGGFRSLLLELLEPFDVVVVDAADPAVKEGSAPILARELDEGAAHEEILRERADRLRDAGYPVQVPILEGALNLFTDGPAGRERIFRDGDGFRLRASGTRLSGDEVRRRLEAEPGRFSPNVLLRPVVESHVFPVLALVAGPGELSYAAELGCLFDAHDLGMPLVFPRHSVVLVESKVRKVLEKFGLEIDELRRPVHEVVGEIAREEVPDDVREALNRIRRAIGEGSGELQEAARAIDPTLKGPVQTARNASFSAFNDAEDKIVQAVKRQDEIAQEQVGKAHLHLFPDGKPQERVLNVFYYLFRYGPGLLESLAGRFDVELDGSAPEWRGVDCDEV